MHIPESMLQGGICPFSAALAVVGISAAGFFAFRTKARPTASRFGAITALIFATQAMNFPILHGTSGHLLGGVLAASLLGTPFGVLAIALVVAIQSLIFADGGLVPLGANLLNMALIGAGLGGLIGSGVTACWPGRPRLVLAFAAWVSVVLASIAVGIELAVDGQLAFASVMPAMLGIHILIGFGEALLTVAACALFGTRAEPAGDKVLAPLSVAFLLALIASPWASPWPDGLEWVAERYRFLHESAPLFVSPLADYRVAGLGEAFWSGSLAMLAGVLLCFTTAWMLARFMAVRLPSSLIRPFLRWL